MYRDPALPHATAPTPLYLRASIGVHGSMAGLHLAPDIPAKVLQGVLTYAQPAPGELPLAVVDSSVLLSGKSGMLLTDRAVWFDAPRARVPLELVTHPPTRAPDGRRMQLVTPMGAALLPDALDEQVAAMARCLTAVARFHQGASRYAFAGAPFAGPVAEAFAATTWPSELEAAPAFRARGVHAASNAGATWLDHDAGEELLVFRDESISHDGSRGLALTDRRIVYVGRPEQSVPYAHLTGATLKSGLVATTLTLATPAGPVRVETSALEAQARVVLEFLTRLGSVAPQHRVAFAPPPPGADDPTGAVTALRTLGWPEARAAALLELVHALGARGALRPDLARDHVARALRLHRTLRGGHGRTEGSQRTPLAAADLESVFRTLLGVPVRHGHDRGGRALEFELSSGGSAAGTLASSVVGLTMLAVVGIGWVGGGGPRVRRVRLRIWEAPGGAAFTLHDDHDAPLAKSEGTLAGTLLEALAEASAPALLRRVMGGWDAPLEALYAEPEASLDARIRALVPGLGAALFTPT